MLYSKFQKIMRVFTQFHTNFTQFCLFKPFLGQFLHVGYQNACTRAEKFIGNTFKKFHARVHPISRNFHAIWAISAIFWPISTCWVSKSMYSSLEILLVIFSRNLDYFSHFWANFNMLGIKKLRNSLVVLGEA